MDYKAFASFVAVIDHGSFTKAAKELGLPKSTVSRHVSRLENSLKVELIRRTTRKLLPTELGMRLFQRSRSALIELQDAAKEVQDLSGVVRGSLRITAPQDFSTTKNLGLFIKEFCDIWPDIRIEMNLENRFVDLVGEGYDFAIRPLVHDGPMYDGLKIKKMGHVTFSLFASPDYLSQNTEIVRLSDLQNHRCMASHMTKNAWYFESEKGEKERVEVDPILRSGGFDLILTSLLSGFGVGILPTIAARGALDTGDLVAILPKWYIGKRMMALMWPATRNMAPRVRAFIDFTFEHKSILGIE